MAVMEPPDQHAEVGLLKELERVDELLLDELERVDEMLRRIVVAIDRLPERIASASRSEIGPVSGNGTSAAEPARGRASTRPFDPYGEDEVEVGALEVTEPAVSQVARKVRNWVAAHASDPEAAIFATVSLAVAMLAIAIALVGLIVAVF
jgi:hypothetical protein